MGTVLSTPEACPKCRARNSFLIVDIGDAERRCMICGMGESGTRWEEVEPEKKGPKAGSAFTHCRRGHVMDDDNVYESPQGGRQCKTCKNEATARWRKHDAEKKAAQAV